MTRAHQILDAVRRLPTEAPTLSPEEEEGLVDALDQADRGDLVDGAEAFAKVRGRVRDAR